MSEPPRIVVVDGLTANPGDLSWSALERLGSLTVHERSGEQLIEHCAQADVVLTNKEVFGEGVLARLPTLRFIGITATGTNVVDLEAAARHGVTVSNVPAYSTESVAQHVFALLLELNNRTSDHSAFSRSGGWTESGHFSCTLSPITELAGKTFGIVGLGHIGRRVAEIARAFGMQVLAANKSTTSEAASADPAWLERAPLAELFERADVLSLHCPLTPRTRYLVNADRLGSMQRSAILINTGRGPLIDERALAEALHAGRLRGAGLDVLGDEPPSRDNPLLHAPRVLITPHLGWASVEARRRLIQVSADNVAAFLRGAPQNVVSAAAQPSPEHQAPALPVSER